MMISDNQRRWVYIREYGAAAFRAVDVSLMNYVGIVLELGTPINQLNTIALIWATAGLPYEILYRNNCARSAVGTYLRQFENDDEDISPRKYSLLGTEYVMKYWQFRAIRLLINLAKLNILFVFIGGGLGPYALAVLMIQQKWLALGLTALFSGIASLSYKTTRIKPMHNNITLLHGRFENVKALPWHKKLGYYPLISFAPITSLIRLYFSTRKMLVLLAAVIGLNSSQQLISIISNSAGLFSGLCGTGIALSSVSEVLRLANPTEPSRHPQRIPPLVALKIAGIYLLMLPNITASAMFSYTACRQLFAMIAPELFKQTAFTESFWPADRLAAQLLLGVFTVPSMVNLANYTSRRVMREVLTEDEMSAQPKDITEEEQTLLPQSKPRGRAHAIN